MRQIIVLAVVFAAGICSSYSQTYQRTITWQPPARHQVTDAKTVYLLSFENASYDVPYGRLPYYYERIPLAGAYTPDITAKISNTSFSSLPDEEAALIRAEDISTIQFEIPVSASVGVARKSPFALISIFPFRKNPSSGRIEKLISFTLELNTSAALKTAAAAVAATAASSVLANGNWYKLSVVSDGVYRLSYSFLQGLGLNMTSLDPRNIRIYGNGGGMLPLANSAPRKDDLFENAIWVSGESDGRFDADDYILFYAKGPHTWTYNATSTCIMFEHQDNFYSEKSFYFLTADLGSGKRIATQLSASETPTSVITSFDDYGFHETNSVNFLKSGREWYGEEFDIVTSYTIPFSFPDINPNGTHYIKADVRARCLGATSFNFSINGNTAITLNVPKLNSLDYDDPHAAYANQCQPVASSSSSLNVTVSFTKDPNKIISVGWLNYIAMNVRRQLKFSGSQVAFRDAKSVGAGNSNEYVLSNASSGLRIWEITDPLVAKEQGFSLPNANEIHFTASADSLRQFIAFKSSSLAAPVSEGKIINQNLHGISASGEKQPDLIIITSPLFLTEAQRLAGHHSNFDGMNVVIVTPDQIFNEFSSGAQDVAALRDFIKMFYDRAQGNTDYLPRYVLLFGDASYDPLNRIANNTNFVPAYESNSSDYPIGTYTSDDFFGCLDINEGGNELASSLVDVGIGRIVVNTVDGAKEMVDKIIHYVTDPSTMRDWRNVLCFLGDDEDSNLHIDQADQLATLVDTSYNNYNVDKIYLDSYVQVYSGGSRYPDVKTALLRRIGRGALIINWTGHGGELGWAHERIFETPDIIALDNWNNLPIFVTATCEFSRFDDPERTAAGEYVQLNPRGGGIALLTTTRLAFANENFNLNKFFFNVVFKDINGDFPRLGDIIRLTKVSSGVSQNIRNFHLLGDPAMRLSYPVHNVITDSINQKSAGTVPDTISALSKVTFSGHLVNKYTGQKMSGFNGVVYPTVFDKAEILTTLKNDEYSKIKNFTLQKNILYKGKASVKNGKFSFTFLVPKDINYRYGNGRVSYYAEDQSVDASGYFENFTIGGSSDTVLDDQNGPEISLFMNDENFVSGGLTDENPYIYAKLRDENGINTVGVGIGHDIVAILDGNTSGGIVLNDYYEADLDSFRSGSLQYRLSDLTEGSHTLKLKVWDILNNSSETEIEFVVTKAANFSLDHVLNYPNPFTTHTSFMFEHNKPGQDLNIQVQVLTVSGKLIKTIDALVNTAGYRVPHNTIDWDGRDEYGDKIGRGVYMYRLKVRTPDGAIADQYEKLVILN